MSLPPGVFLALREPEDARFYPSVIPVQSFAPPSSARVWLDTSTTPATFKSYNGTAWTAIGTQGPQGTPGAAIAALATGSTVLADRAIGTDGTTVALGNGSTTFASLPDGRKFVTNDGGDARWQRDLGIVNVKDHGATGNGATDDTTAITAAASAAGSGRTLYFPPGTYRFSSTIIGVRDIRGSGRARTVLDYTGTGTAIQVSPVLGTRSYHGRFDGFLLRSTLGTAAVGMDLDSHSVGEFSSVAVQSFGTGFRLRSTIDDGGCLYNTFIHCEAVTCTTGWLIEAQSSNENRLIACRTNGAGTGVHITHGNHNHIISCAFESGTDGVHVEGGTSSDGNVIAFCRFEANSDQAVVVATGVRDTSIFLNNRLSTGGTILDNGLRTKHVPGLPTSAHMSVERNIDMGADVTTPAFAVRDTLATVGSPNTMELQNERFGGKFMRGVRGGTERFAINAEGAIRPFAAVTASLPSASRAGAGGMAYNTTTSKPVWSDGTVWRYADGTAV